MNGGVTPWLIANVGHLYARYLSCVGLNSSELTQLRFKTHSWEGLTNHVARRELVTSVSSTGVRYNAFG